MPGTTRAELGPIDRRPSPTDRRVNEAMLSGEGRKAIAALQIRAEPVGES